MNNYEVKKMIKMKIKVREKRKQIKEGKDLSSRFVSTKRQKGVDRYCLTTTSRFTHSFTNHFIVLFTNFI